MVPPLSGLRAFEAVARHLSATRAAEELAVTQPAVTPQVRRLEAQLGVRLVRRDGRRLALTPEGQAYAASLGRAFEQIRLGTDRCLHARQAGTLTIALLPPLAIARLLAGGRLSLPMPPQGIEAELAGLGVALAHRPFVADGRVGGRLVQPVTAVVEVERGFWLAGRREDAGLPRLRAFRDWLLEQV